MIEKQTFISSIVKDVDGLKQSLQESKEKIEEKADRTEVDEVELLVNGMVWYAPTPPTCELSIFHSIHETFDNLFCPSLQRT